MRIRPTSVAVLAAVPLFIAGCSQGAPEQPPAKPAAQQPAPAPAQPAVSPEGVKWVDQLCGNVGSFAAAQQQQGSAIDKSNTETFKSSSLAQIDSSTKTADETLKGLTDMGPSPIPGADKVNDTFKGGFVQVRDVLNGAKSKAEQVDTSNEQAFTSGMVGVQQELKKGESINFDAQFAEFDKNQELNAAANQAPACKALMAPPQQPQQPQQPEQPPQPR